MTVSTTQQRSWIALAVGAARRAGAAILDVYQSDFAVEHKEDHSPLTEADTRSWAIIETALAETGIPILGEEGRDIAYEKRREWEWFWLVDPLDGTKEFVKRNDEFTVNIALIHDSTTVGGVVSVPVTAKTFLAVGPDEAFVGTLEPASDAPELPWEELAAASQRLPLATDRTVFTSVASRSHMSPETREYVDSLKEQHGEVRLVSRGSSLKLCMLAEGEADIYPRFAPTMEWDTAAGHAIIKCSGGNVYQTDETSELAYNKENLLNPWFVAKSGGLLAAG